MTKILNILNHSPTTQLLKLRNRNIVIEFLLLISEQFKQGISSEKIQQKLADFLEFKQLENDDESGIFQQDSYDEKAKKYITHWTNNGFLINYPADNGDIVYELSIHSLKAIDFLFSLQRKEFVGTESKFSNILYQLKELVEFTNEDKIDRLSLLKQKKLEIEQQIQRIESGAENIKIFEDYEISSRVDNLNQEARELLSDFQEVKENFKTITKDIHQKYAEKNMYKGDILALTFDALTELQNSAQGKSFYSFWQYLLDDELDTQWQQLTQGLYTVLQEKNLEAKDNFLKEMKMRLYKASSQVYEANNQMAKKLNYIICDQNNGQYQVYQKILQDIKKQLLRLNLETAKPEITFTVENKPNINLPFERRLTLKDSPNTTFNVNSEKANSLLDLSDASLQKLFNTKTINKKALRQKIKQTLSQHSQISLANLIQEQGGITQGLGELVTYFTLIKEFKHQKYPENPQQIIIDAQLQKCITIPEVILINEKL